jgi:alpha-maltose-1-phosphate synthase
MNDPNFGICFIGDGYSTDKKIMGRQSAGKSLIRGISRKWHDKIISGYGPGTKGAQAMFDQLKSDGFSGKVRWYDAQAQTPPIGLNSVYFPAPPSKAMAHHRNGLGPASYSIFGVTHTLSSTGAMDQIGNLILPPFQPWDALICTSSAALAVVDNIHEAARSWWARSTGASRFNSITKAVIPLGINASDFKASAEKRATIRKSMGLTEDDICFLFAGRMTFHAKANPVAFYQAIEKASQQLNKRLVCIEAGIYPNDGAKEAFDSARVFFAPSARFIAVDGADQEKYDGAWAAADVFVSLSDNIQETFGITPLEAMAAGLPVIVSDWNGYKDTVRDGIDGFRIPVIMPGPGTGEDLAIRHDEETDSYDYFIGKVSMATVIDVGVLTQRICDLAVNPSLRQTLGLAGQSRATHEFDWSVVLNQYVQLTNELEAMRARSAGGQDQIGRLNRPDPFALFSHYPTQLLSGDMTIEVNPSYVGQSDAMLNMGIARYVLDPASLPREAVIDMLGAAQMTTTVAELMLACPQYGAHIKTRAIMWLAKMGMLILGHRNV